MKRVQNVPVKPHSLIMVMSCKSMQQQQCSPSTEVCRFRGLTSLESWGNPLIFMQLTNGTMYSTHWNSLLSLHEFISTLLKYTVLLIVIFEVLCIFTMIIYYTLLCSNIMLNYLLVPIYKWSILLFLFCSYSQWCENDILEMKGMSLVWIPGTSLNK